MGDYLMMIFGKVISRIDSSELFMPFALLVVSSPVLPFQHELSGLFSSENNLVWMGAIDDFFVVEIFIKPRLASHVSFIWQGWSFEVIERCY